MSSANSGTTTSEDSTRGAAERLVEIATSIGVDTTVIGEFAVAFGVSAPPAISEN